MLYRLVSVIEIFMHPSVLVELVGAACAETGLLGRAKGRRGRCCSGAPGSVRTGYARSTACYSSMHVSHLLPMRHVTPGQEGERDA